MPTNKKPTFQNAGHPTTIDGSTYTVDPSTLGTGIDAAKIADGSVSNTEFQYVNGVTSAIQTQLDGKAASSHTHTLSNITDVTATAAELNLLDLAGLTAGWVLRASGATSAAWAAIQAGDLPTGIDAAKIADGSISNTEFQYLNGATSNIQSQIDALSASSSRIASTLDNESGSTIAAGMAVYVSGDGEVTAAQANSTTTSNVLGIASAAISDSASGLIVTSGPVTLADWTAIIGTTNLTPGSEYFLSAGTAGLLTATAPTSAGNCQAIVGVATHIDTLHVRPQPYAVV